MSDRLKQYSTNGIEQTEWNPNFGWTDQSPVSPDGFQFTFGPNEVKNFLDDGIGIAIAANSTTDTVIEDAIPFGSART